MCSNWISLLVSRPGHPLKGTAAERRHLGLPERTREGRARPDPESSTGVDAANGAGARAGDSGGRSRRGLLRGRARPRVHPSPQGGSPVRRRMEAVALVGRNKVASRPNAQRARSHANELPRKSRHHRERRPKKPRALRPDGRGRGEARGRRPSARARHRGLRLRSVSP
jgi:hypothetical protein